MNVGTPEDPADIEQILADNKTLGIQYFGSGSTPIFPLIYTTEAQWIAYAEYLNELGALARQQGQTLMVHNHDIEFEIVFGDQTVFDILMANTDPRNVVFQLDPLLGDQRRRPRQPPRGARALRQPHPALPRQGHGRRSVPRPRSRSSARIIPTSRRSSPLLRGR